MSQANPRFEATVMPHLDAAYNLARWLVKDEHAAEDVVQDAYLRAFRYVDSFRGMDARPWLLGIVRNNCYSWLETAKRSKGHVEFDEEREMDESVDMEAIPGRAENPETLLMRKAEKAELNAAIRSLPTTFREVLILREIEEMPYDTIAAAMQIPIGTVMSRLSRARGLLRTALETTMGKQLYGT
jgi:RNA polymerase sigma-70 factor, ECF subfamily